MMTGCARAFTVTYFVALCLGCGSGSETSEPEVAPAPPSPPSAVPPSAVPPSAVPLSTVPLSAVPLSAVPLSAVPLSAAPVDGEPALAPLGDDAHRRARDDARLVLERYCGTCHISAYDTAVPGALAVYDLLDEEWAARATDLQLRDIVFRLGEPLGPDAEALEVQPEERATVERYVDAEIARRAVGAATTAATAP